MGHVGGIIAIDESVLTVFIDSFTSIVALLLLLIAILLYKPNTGKKNWKYIFYILSIEQFFKLIDLVLMKMYTPEIPIANFVFLGTKLVFWILMTIGYINSSEKLFKVFIGVAIVLILFTIISLVVCYKKKDRKTAFSLCKLASYDVISYLNFYLILGKVFGKVNRWDIALSLILILFYIMVFCTLFNFILLLFKKIELERIKLFFFFFLLIDVLSLTIFIQFFDSFTSNLSNKSLIYVSFSIFVVIFIGIEIGMFLNNCETRYTRRTFLDKKKYLTQILRLFV